MASMHDHTVKFMAPTKEDAERLMKTQGGHMDYQNIKTGNVVKAIQYNPGHGMEDGFEIPNVGGSSPVKSIEGAGFVCYDAPPVRPFIGTSLEKRQYLTPGDWIVTQGRGVRFPVKDDVFALAYEPCTDEKAAVGG